MHIQSINKSTPTFNGSYKFKGTWTTKMKEVSLPFLEELAKGDKEIIANMNMKRTFEGPYKVGKKIYQLSLTSREEKRSLWERVKNKLGFGNIRTSIITANYKKANSTVYILKDLLSLNNGNLNIYRKKLNINNR